MPSNPRKNHKIHDALDQSWVYKFTHRSFWPYLQLMRADRPIGTYLLFWPAIWSTLAAEIGTIFDINRVLWHGLLFFVGAYVMRGAGCIWNDILDRDLDAQVERTRNRPIASGQVTPQKALLFMMLLLLIGLGILWQFNVLTRIIGLISIPIVTLYPLMKRITYYPQFVLGLAFNWGALVGWTASRGTIDAPMLLLYAAGLFWTLSYDTIYAHQDKSDDAIIGVKSTALKLGNYTKPFIALMNLFTLVLCATVLWLTKASILSYLGLGLVGLHFIYQIKVLNIDEPTSCLNMFRANHLTGAIIGLTLLLGSWRFELPM